ncbi:hypothetical protein Bca52824_035087 [Brassica carinata]|uniref:Uncharacterized protein n=1 Tax=Brassica carinata TaxID=52824 RepID=A0A8X7S4I8_BRACI|nr:hypothetical protein Bca52824_035087 [Brassica carinata]
MSKRSGSSVPLTAERLGSRRRTDSPVSKSGSSSDPHDESGHISLAPAPLSSASPIPPLVSPTSSVGEKDLEEWRKSYSLPSSVIDDIVMASGRKRLRNRATGTSYGNTFLAQPDPSASTSGTSSAPENVPESQIPSVPYVRPQTYDPRGPILLALRARSTLLELECFLSSVVRWLILLAPTYCVVADYGAQDDGESRGHLFFSWEEVEGQDDCEVTSTILWC